MTRARRAPAGLDRTALIPAGLLFVATVGFGTSRDFGVFLLGLAVLPMLGLVTLAWIALAALAGGARVSALGPAVSLALLSVPAMVVANAERDRVRFAGWAVRHLPLARYAARAGVIEGWDSWGMAGSENDSYLVADPSDTIGTLPTAERWRRRMGLDCPIVDTQRMWARLYVVTTYNCPFGFDGRRWS